MQEKGHWKHNCPKVTKDPGMGNLNFVKKLFSRELQCRWIIIQEPLTMFVTLYSGSDKLAWLW